MATITKLIAFLIAAGLAPFSNADVVEQSIPRPDASYLAQLVYEAKRAGRLFPDFYRINPALDDESLYDVQAKLVSRLLADGDEIIGYKGGFVPRAPIGGVLLKSGLLSTGARIKRADFSLLIVEAEIAFRFCADVSSALADLAALKDVVCELAPALEIADGALADFAALKTDFTHLRATLIPLNVAYHQVLVGSSVSADSIDLFDLPVSMQHNGTTIGQRKLEQAGDLWAQVLWVVNEYVLRRGYTIKAGQFIIPGNQTGIHVGEVGEYRADFGALGALPLSVDP